MTVNEKIETLNFVITPGKVDDREPLKDTRFLEKDYGKLFADRGLQG